MEVIMRVKIGAECFKGAGTIWELRSYINGVTGKSDPQIRFEWGRGAGENPRPGMFTNLSNMAQSNIIKNLDTGKEFKVSALMDYKG